MLRCRRLIANAVRRRSDGLDKQSQQGIFYFWRFRIFMKTAVSRENVSYTSVQSTSLITYTCSVFSLELLSGSLAWPDMHYPPSLLLPLSLPSEKAIQQPTQLKSSSMKSTVQTRRSKLVKLPRDLLTSSARPRMSVIFLISVHFLSRA